MHETSLSLLARIRDDPSQQAWDRIHRLYEPLIRSWLVRYQLQGTDADDVTQEVLIAVSKDIPGFEHNGRTGAFRAWLRGILVNRLREFWRSRSRKVTAGGDSSMQVQIDQLADPKSELSQIWNQEHDQHVLRGLLLVVREEFQATTWKAFEMSTIEGMKAKDVAEKLEISRNAVFVAKSRVLARLRTEAEGIVDAGDNFFASL